MSDNNSDEVLVSNLSFPNGLVISPNEDFIVVSEMSVSRLLKVYISGKLKGQTSVFLDKLPGRFLEVISDIVLLSCYRRFPFDKTASSKYLYF